MNLCFFLPGEAKPIETHSSWVLWIPEAIKDTPIVQQSVVWAMSASSIPIGMAFSATLDGREGEAETCAG